MRIGAEPVIADNARSVAVEAARTADVAIVVVGYDGRWESEGFDRPNMDLPGRAGRADPRGAGGEPAHGGRRERRRPGDDGLGRRRPRAAAVVFPGQECGAALAQVLFGDVDASGRLPTTFARRLEDTPALANYPGNDGQVHYAEGLFVGYRHYDRHHVEPRFCFGHGLSYTSFDYANLAVSGATVSVDLTNTGPRPGSEVVQVYVHDVSASVERPEQELAQFAKVHLAPGETRRVELVLDERAFSFWDVERHDWRSRTW